MKIQGWITLLVLSLSSSFYSCEEDSFADVIYHNATVITMTGEDSRASAIAINDGKITAVGTDIKVLEWQGPYTKVVDLNGKTLLPGFIDAHSHIMMGMQIVNHANLSSPPVAGIQNIADIIETLKVNQKEQNLKEGEWIQGWGYDPDLLEEGRHPNKFDLDRAFPDNPVFIMHVSGHLGVLNSKALEIMGFNSETPDPQDGQIMRLPGSNEPDGVVAEMVLHLVNNRLPKIEPEKAREVLKKTFDLYMSNGITTANDGYSTPEYINLLEEISASDKFPIDVISLVGFKDMAKYIGDEDFAWKTYKNGLKYAGVKIITDGSPQGKTAKMTSPYLTEVPGCAHDCTGISVISQEQTDQLLQLLYSKGIQVYAHCNGDGAIDMFLNAHDKAINSTHKESKTLRSVIIHSQFMRPDLIDQYARYGLIPSYFTNHTYFWGDVHMANMGLDRTNYTSPMRASNDAGITYTNHSDYPITPLSPSFMLWSAVNRTSRSGAVIGEYQKASAYEALKALTINAAYQYFEEDIKGTIEVGKLADLVVLSHDPLSIDPTQLKSTTVLETIKEGKTVYLRKEL